ncbi:MAG TPA: DNA mismatch repair protein MutS, partial [Dehalococcoidia bacterium]|nr:DNA mismatch repair protein MutS [Dehalococcoidia bacterium]
MSTPARRQYLEIKAQHPDALLLYQMGDFYELFDDDARIAARDLNITLTSREFGRSGRVPMAGVPVAALAGYLRRLLAKGHRVAICDQAGNAQQNGPGLIDRSVRCVVTPGTATDPGLISPTENGYLIALVEAKDGIGLASIDASTGEFAATQFRIDEEAELAGELARLQPRECLVIPAGESGSRLTESVARSLLTTLGTALTERDFWRFGPEIAGRRLRDQFGVASVEAFGCAEWPLAIGAAGAIVDYLAETNRQLLSGLRPLQSYSTRSFVRLDLFTRRNLEIFRSARAGDRHQSLVAVIDRTKSAAGGRLLRRWLGQPLTDVTELSWRLDAVEALVENLAERRTIRSGLANVSDLERLVARLRQGLVTHREVLGIPETLEAVPPLLDALAGLAAPPLRALRHNLDPCLDLADLIRRALSDHPGELIRAGFSEELDEVRAAAADARRWIAKLEQAERARTGIRTLKVGYNRVFGYYIEVTRPNLKLVPADYRRTQTLANAERFITAELKQHETVVVNAQDRVAALEGRLFEDLTRALAAAAQRLRDLADALAQLDVYAALAELADAGRYVRPDLHAGPEIEIEGGRHPVVEARLPPGDFVPNDLRIGGDHGRILLITGPNMAGKSTCLRQVALISLLGQIGSFVPAESARLGLVDRIFTRIGAQDDLAAGASTFLVEMVETANILRHASDHSLVILDEIGRGTSTWDGLA